MRMRSNTMRTKKLRARTYLPGAAALVILGAGTAESASARLHAMNLDAPDRSAVQVHYSGNDAPKVEVVPATTI